jgi:hypothetical protein
MQFIERLFGLFPDRGSGLLELSLVAILLSAVTLRLALGCAIKRSDTRISARRR